MDKNNTPLNNNSNHSRQQQFDNNPPENLSHINYGSNHNRQQQINNIPTENLSHINNNNRTQQQNNFQNNINIPNNNNFRNQNNNINNFYEPQNTNFQYNNRNEIYNYQNHPPQFSHYQNPNMNLQSPWIFRNNSITFDEQTGSYTDQSGIYSIPHLNNRNRISPQSNLSQFPPPVPIIPPDPHLAPPFPNPEPLRPFPNQNNNYFPHFVPPSNQFSYNNRVNQRNEGPFLPNNMMPHIVPPQIFPSVNIGSLRSNKNKKLIESLEEVEITGEILNKFKIKECNICLDEYKVGDKISYLPCFHYFHYICIKEWIKKSKQCPLCKNEIKFE